MADFEFTYRGLTIGGDTAYPLVRVDGLGQPGVRSGDRAATGRHGLWPGDHWLNGRTLVLDLEVERGATDTTWEARVDAFASAFRPGLDDEAALVFQVPGIAGGGERRVYVRTSRRDLPVDQAWALRESRAAVELVATDPRIYDETQQSDSVGLPTATGGWSFPWSFDWSFGGGGIGGTIFANNAGTFPAPLTVRFDGPVTDPRITNVTLGQVLELDLTVASGQYVELDTLARTVLLNGTANRYEALSNASRWFDLDPGTNELAFQGTGSGSTVTVTWRSTWI